MKKILLASTAAAFALGIGAANAAEPGMEKYFHERGNFDASMQQRGPAPDLAGWPAYTTGAYGYGEPVLGYAPEGYGYAPVPQGGGVFYR